MEWGIQVGGGQNRVFLSGDEQRCGKMYVFAVSELMVAKKEREILLEMNKKKLKLKRKLCCEELLFFSQKGACGNAQVQQPLF